MISIKKSNLHSASIKYKCIGQSELGGASITRRGGKAVGVTGSILGVGGQGHRRQGQRPCVKQTRFLWRAGFIKHSGWSPRPGVIQG